MYVSYRFWSASEYTCIFISKKEVYTIPKYKFLLVYIDIVLKQIRVFKVYYSVYIDFDKQVKRAWNFI